MAYVRPFRATRYAPDAGDIETLVCPPYDVISTQEQSRLLVASPYNVVRLEKPSDYNKAASILNQWLDDGVLTRDDAPTFTVYQMAFSDRGVTHTVTGVLGDLQLEPFSNGTVLPHEETLPKARGDRFALMAATRYQFSPIYCLYRDEQAAVMPILHTYVQTQPDYAFTQGDGVTHRFWTVSDAGDTAAITAAFADKTLYIADGHHRYTTMLEFHAERPGLHTGGVMTMLVDMADDGLVIWPTHRLLHNLSDFSPAAVVTKLHQHFHITLSGDIATLEQHLSLREDTVAFYAGDGHYALLTLRDKWDMARTLPGHSAAYQSLDVVLLHAMILEPVFGIGAEQLAAQSHVRYTRSLTEALTAVDSSDVQCAFILNATRIDQMAAVSLAGERMPQKSTYFHPKLITGVVMKSLD